MAFPLSLPIDSFYACVLIVASKRKLSAYYVVDYSAHVLMIGLHDVDARSRKNELNSALSRTACIHNI